MSGKGPAWAAVGVGAVFLYSGIKGESILKAAQNIVQGNSPTSGQSTTSFTTDTTSATEQQNQTTINNATGNTGANNNGAAKNQAIAKPLAAAKGWTGQQWTDLVKLWNQESGWSNTAENASGAYGVAQALPNTKYPKAGQPPSEGGNADATTQIIWGLDYIQGTYGNPSVAWDHELAHGWY